MPNVHDDDQETLFFADESEYMTEGDGGVEQQTATARTKSLMTINQRINGLVDKAEHVVFLAGAWKDFGYENPPAPECAAVPPLGERSAEAVKAGHSAVTEIDELTAQLSRLRAQLVSEMRQDEDIRAARP